MDTIRQFCETRAQHPQSIFSSNRAIDKTEFLGLIYASLWGNRSDLSLTPEGIQKEDIRIQHDGKTAKISKILIDDAEQIWDLVKNERRSADENVVIILDNAGFELVCDLFLADALILSKIAKTVTFHLKAHPT